MKHVVDIQKEGKTVVQGCRVATDFVSRLVGLMASREGATMLFPKCNSIHTFFMPRAIDVVFIEDKGRVLEVIASLKPWRFLAPRWKAKYVLELDSGFAQKVGIQMGSQLACAAQEDKRRWF